MFTRNKRGIATRVSVRPEPVEGLVVRKQGFDRLSPNGKSAACFSANAGCRQGPGMLMSKCHLLTLLIPPRGAAATPPGGALRPVAGDEHGFVAHRPQPLRDAGDQRVVVAAGEIGAADAAANSTSPTKARLASAL